jgi:hypothetical protein
MLDLDVVRWAESPIGFYVDRTWDADARSWVIGNRPIKLAGYHADLLRHILTPGADGRLPYDVIAWCEPAKSGKSAIAGLVAQYVGLHGDPGSAVVLAGNKRDQAASLMYTSFAESVRANPVLQIEPGRFETELPNGCTVRAIPSNSRGEAGARFSLVLFDELWGYVHEDAQRLWSEFKTDPTRQLSLKMALGYGGYIGESDLWHDLLQRGLAGEPVPDLAHIVNADGSPTCYANGRHFVFWSHTCRQAWQTEQWIESQRKTLRENEFRRMVGTEFVEGSGDFIAYEDWLALVDPAHKQLEPDQVTPVFVGLDIATKPGGDDCACIAVYGDADKTRIAWHKVWRGGRNRTQALKLSETVQPFLIEQARRYYIQGVYYDPFQALQLAENLTRAGLWCVEVPQTHASRGPKDTALFELAANGQLVLYDDPELKAMASAASARELGNGLLWIEKGGRGKIDLLIALSNCADEVRKMYTGAWVTLLDQVSDDEEW